MGKINRRAFCGVTLGATVLGSVSKLKAEATDGAAPEQARAPYIIDTNVNLGQWPFRRLKYEGAAKLGNKLKKHRIRQAWAGNFDALFHKNIDAVNSRLVQECQSFEKNFFQPFGTVNLAWWDWEEDLRRCHEQYKMKGVRIFPSFQTFDLTHESFPKLLSETARRGMILQIVGDMEDSRNHHPLMLLRDFSYAPLLPLLKQIPEAKVHLLYWNHRVSAKLMDDLIDNTKVLFDTARIEGAGGIEAFLEGNKDQKSRVFSFGGIERTLNEIPWGRSSKPLPPERLTFGSHAPFFPVEANLIKLFESELNMAQSSAIMESNAQKLINS